MVDDAHGLGVIGKGGRGTASYFGLEDQVDVIMGTFSKSLASLGGFMAGKERVVDYVRHNSRPFIFSASIPPSNCAVALEALRQLKKRPELVERLAQLSAYARKGLTERGLSLRPSETPIIPIYTYDAIRHLGQSQGAVRCGGVCQPGTATCYARWGVPAADQLYGQPHRGRFGRGPWTALRQSSERIAHEDRESGAPHRGQLRDWAVYRPIPGEGRMPGYMSSAAGTAASPASPIWPAM